MEGIPSLHIVDKEYAAEKLPFVIFIHGFGSAKEHNLHYAYLLAEKGIRVVLPETIFHGERETGLGQKEINFLFWDIVLTTIDELNVIKEYFDAKGLIDIERIGLAGTSMGGIITLGALTKYDWIHSAVSLMGVPSYELYARMQIHEMSKKGVAISREQQDQLMGRLKNYDLSLQPEKLKNRPLLFWHGKLDGVVPYQLAYQFYQEIKNEYTKVQFLTDEKAGHKVGRKGVLKTVDWFEKHLKLQNTNMR